MTKEFDPFAPSSGLADDFDAEITNVEFGYRSQYQGGEQALLILTLRSTDGTTFGKDNEIDTEQIYSCGGSWEVTPGTNGGAVRRVDGKEIAFNKSSAVWAFIEAMMKLDGGVLRKAGDPRKIEGYRALPKHWHWKRVNYQAMGNETKDRLLPSGKAQGVAPATSNGTTAPATPAATAPVATAPVASAPAPDALTLEQHTHLTAIAARVAAEGGDQEKFVEAVFGEVAEAETTVSITNAVLDMAPTSIWGLAAAAKV